MKLYLDTTPLRSGHNVRGVGYYTENLLASMKRYHKEIKLVPSIEQADVIHYPYFDLFFRTLPLYQKKPTVVTVHDTIPLLFKGHFKPGIKGTLRYWLQRRALARVAAIVTVSQASKHDIHTHLGIKDKRIAVVYPAIPDSYKPLIVAEATRVKKKYKLPASFLLYVGDVNYNKNIPMLIEAFAKVSFTQTVLVLVGKAFLNNDIPEVKAINQAIDGCALADRVIKLGYVAEDDMPALFNAATIYIQPSLYEGFGIPVAQALACGTPVISTNKGGLAEVASDAAYIVEPDSPITLSRGINEVLGSITLRQTLAQKGPQQAKQFTQKRMADEIVQVYHDILR